MASASPLDPIALAQALIRRPSVTPADAGALDVLQQALAPLGFSCRRMRFGEIDNLYARRGTDGPNLCFAGHTDVVPPGDAAAWAHGPFSGDLDGGLLWGRGAADMKGAIAAFAAAVSRLPAQAIGGSVSLLITGDEEGVAVDGTRAVLAALVAEGETLDHAVVGEPTCQARLGDMIKIGRRGSIGAEITVHGRQGHVAYPHLAANPVPVLVRLLAALDARVLDVGHPRFPASNLEITSVDVGNPAANVIPARAGARLNIRFNPHHTGAALAAWLEKEARRAGEGFAGSVEITTHISGEAFLTEPGAFSAKVAEAARAVTGLAPELSTTGGTSDARFLRAHCEVVEFGLVGQTMHKVDEHVPEADVRTLADIYERLIRGYFSVPPG